MTDRRFSTFSPFSAYRSSSFSSPRSRSLVVESTRSSRRTKSPSASHPSNQRLSQSLPLLPLTPASDSSVLASNGTPEPSRRSKEKLPTSRRMELLDPPLSTNLLASSNWATSTSSSPLELLLSSVGQLDQERRLFCFPSSARRTSSRDQSFFPRRSFDSTRKVSRTRLPTPVKSRGFRTCQLRRTCECVEVVHVRTGTGQS